MPFKFKIFNWIIWDNKILTMENLSKCGCNRILTTTCMLYHEPEETVDHLLVNYQFATQIQMHFPVHLNTLSTPSILKEIWSTWGTNSLKLTSLGNLLICVGLFGWKKHGHIFNGSAFFCFSICKIDHMLIAWINATPDAKKAKFEKFIPTIKRSLNFAGNSFEKQDLQLRPSDFDT